MKPLVKQQELFDMLAATFGWLCVETISVAINTVEPFAATFGWLCVETVMPIMCGGTPKAATFGWLCVETTPAAPDDTNSTRSHLRVAVC